MLEAMKVAGALAGLMKNKEQIQQRMSALKDRLGSMSAEGESGGGAVRVRVSGKMRVVGVQIDPNMASNLGASNLGADASLAERLIADATNDALDKARAMMQEEVRKEAEAMGLPNDLAGLSGMLS